MEILIVLGGLIWAAISKMVMEKFLLLVGVVVVTIVVTLSTFALIWLAVRMIKNRRKNKIKKNKNDGPYRTPAEVSKEEHKEIKSEEISVGKPVPPMPEKKAGKEKPKTPKNSWWLTEAKKEKLALDIVNDDSITIKEKYKKSLNFAGTSIFEAFHDRLTKEERFEVFATKQELAGRDKLQKKSSFGSINYSWGNDAHYKTSWGKYAIIFLDDGSAIMPRAKFWMQSEKDIAKELISKLKYGYGTPNIYIVSSEGNKMAPAPWNYMDLVSVKMIDNLVDKDEYAYLQKVSDEVLRLW